MKQYMGKDIFLGLSYDSLDVELGELLYAQLFEPNGLAVLCVFLEEISWHN